MTFRRAFPAKGRILFDGGKNSKFERSIIEDNESPDCANVVFTNGACETRQGISKFNTASVGSFAGDGLYTRHDDTGAETMVAFFGGTMFRITGTSTFTTIPSAQSYFTAGVRVCASEYENYMFIGNGGVIPQKYNGSNFNRHGVYPPTQTSTAASQATGSLTGDFIYKVTNINSGLVESDVGPVSTTFTAASATIRVSLLQTFAASFGITGRRLYRKSGTTFKRVATISDNTSTTYDDNIADASLGATAPTDNGVPPNYSICTYFENRLFVNDPANPNYLWYSELGNPYTFASTNFMKVGDATSDLIRAIVPYDNAIYLICDKSAFLIYMPDTTPANWKTVKTNSPFGTRSPFCAINIKNAIFHPAVQSDKLVGFTSLSGIAVSPSATFLTVATVKSDLQSERVEPDMFDIQEAFQGDIYGIVFKNKAWISVASGSTATANNLIFIYDFSSGTIKKQPASWSPFTGIAANQFTIYGGELYFATSNATGFVYRAESGSYNDDGVAIDSYLWTKEYSCDDEDLTAFKDFRFVNLLLEKPGDWFMNFTYRVDSDTGSGNTKQIDLNPGGSLWGTMTWGIDTWGGGRKQDRFQIPLNGDRGERIQFKFSNQNVVNQRFKVHALQNIIYNIKGYR